MEIEIGSKGYFSSISEFKLIKDIGVGSFGKVKLAVHRGTRRSYAIKIIDLTANISENQMQIILREIKIHLQLDHPHIIKLWDTLLEENKIYLIMDYAKNGSLFRYHSGLLQSGMVPSIGQIYQFFYQTLQAIKYLHSNDLMHRDIKPENLLLDEDFNIKLCDFGWATNQITCLRTTFCGTYEYMAPEMVLEKSYDYRIDIWALGILLFELAHGKAPFEAQSLKIMKQKINKGSYEIDSNCESNMKDLIVDILQFLPAKRLSIEEIQKHSWVKINMGQAIGQESATNFCRTVKSGAARKHQHQKSLGNFQTDAYKNYFTDSSQEQKHKINIFDYQMTPNLNPSQIKLQQKKHKRNVTQPDTNEYFDHRQETANDTKKTTHVNVNFITEHDATNSGMLDTGYLLLNNQKPKSKCKTQSDKQMSKIDVNAMISNKKWMDQEVSGLKKKKALLTEIGQQSNLGRNQLKEKENDLAIDIRDRTKKKVKVGEKCSKMKKIDEKFLEITNRMEKTRDYDRFYLS